MIESQFSQRIPIRRFRNIARIRRMAAYTLLELLVVLSLLGIISAVAFPNLIRLYDSVSNRMALSDITSQINSIGFKAYQQGHEYWLLSTNVKRDQRLKKFIEMPDGWSLTVANPIQYRANGACLGGIIRLYSGKTMVLNTQLLPPRCQIEAG